MSALVHLVEGYARFARGLGQVHTSEVVFWVVCVFRKRTVRALCVLRQLVTVECLYHIAMSLPEDFACQRLRQILLVALENPKKVQ